MPIAIGILIGLFLFQSRGTTGVGKVFGPVTILWFLSISVLGVHQILRAPEVLARSIRPRLRFFPAQRGRGFVVLGAVFLVVTGGEALYADIGHFGTAPIRLTWFVVVLPALTLNYFGQGALLLRNPEAAVNPFFRMAPAWALFPMVLLATAAAVIASQAIISGAFSLTMQAIQLGYIPRLQVKYTSARVIGQIYVPIVNWALMLSSHRTRARLSDFESARRGLRRRDHHHDADHHDPVLHRGAEAVALAGGRRLPVAAFFITIDLAFFSANMLKVAHGGWFPLLASGLILFLMLTWRKGRKVLGGHLSDICLPLDDLLPDVKGRSIRACPGRRSTCRAKAPARRSRSCTISSTTKCSTNRSSCSPCGRRRFPISPTSRTASRWRK